MLIGHLKGGASVAQRMSGVAAGAVTSAYSTTLIQCLLKAILDCVDQWCVHKTAKNLLSSALTANAATVLTLPLERQALQNAVGAATPPLFSAFAGQHVLQLFGILTVYQHSEQQIAQHLAESPAQIPARIAAGMFAAALTHPLYRSKILASVPPAGNHLQQCFSTQGLPLRLLGASLFFLQADLTKRILAAWEHAASESPQGR